MVVAPAAAFASLFQRSRERDADLVAEIDQQPPDAEGIEAARRTLCAPGFVVPDRNKVGVQMALYLRGIAQSNPEIGKRWLAKGILTTYERTDTDAAQGLFLVNIVWSDDVLNRLIDLQLNLINETLAHKADYCGIAA